MAGSMPLTWTARLPDLFPTMPKVRWCVAGRRRGRRPHSHLRKAPPRPAPELAPRHSEIHGPTSRPLAWGNWRFSQGFFAGGTGAWRCGGVGLRLHPIAFGGAGARPPSGRQRPLVAAGVPSHGLTAGERSWPKKHVRHSSGFRGGHAGTHVGANASVAGQIGETGTEEGAVVILALARRQRPIPCSTVTLLSRPSPNPLASPGVRCTTVAPTANVRSRLQRTGGIRSYREPSAATDPRTPVRGSGTLVP